MRASTVSGGLSGVNVRLLLEFYLNGIAAAYPEVPTQKPKTAMLRRLAPGHPVRVDIEENRLPPDALLLLNRD